MESFIWIFSYWTIVRVIWLTFSLVHKKQVQKVIIIELDSAGKRSKTKFFTWEERLRIAVDAALGQKVNFKICALTVL